MSRQKMLKAAIRAFYGVSKAPKLIPENDLFCIKQNLRDKVYRIDLEASFTKK